MDYLHVVIDIIHKWCRLRKQWYCMFINGIDYMYLVSDIGYFPKQVDYVDIVIVCSSMA